MAKRRRDNWRKHLWGVQSDLMSGKLLICTGYSRQSAQDIAVAFTKYKTWREMYRDGFRAVKVTVTKGWTE